MIDTLNLPCEEKIESNNALCCLCALKVDDKGLYVPESFAISSFVWAICEFITNGYDIDLDKKKLVELQTKINKKLSGETIDSGFSVYKDIFLKICNEISLNKHLTKYVLWAKKKVQKGIKVSSNTEEYFFPPITPATELISSFYIKDIEKVINSPTEKIKQYVCALNNKSKNNKVEIDINTDEMKKCLASNKYPLGMWPSPYHPCLMQQIGINLAISNEQSIFSVNGPPGTGKTTLLKEIVVSNVIQRAIEMMGYDSPDNAFEKRNLRVLLTSIISLIMN